MWVKALGCVGLVCLSGLALSVVAAPAHAAIDEGFFDARDTEGLNELLLDEGLGLGLDEASAADDWTLRAALRHGFAYSKNLPRLLSERGFAQPQQQRDFKGDLAQLALLRYAPPDLFDIAADAEAVVRATAAPGFDIPLAEHPLVQVYIDYFTGRGRGVFQRWLDRSARYIPVMQPILESKGVPLDTVYLAMIESGFSATAYSRAAAGGFWQFIPSTGKLYRLRQDTWVDERRDFIKATESAADYLSDLYKEFGDWHLAWAGYNAGGGRIRRALNAFDATDFWSLLSHRRSLAKETKHYVPKIIAAAIVAKNRAEYGFAAITPPPLAFDEVEVAGAVALSQIANKLGVAQEDLVLLNPSLIYNITPPRRSFVLRVPAGRGPEIKDWLQTLPATERTDYQHYRVSAGDSLWRIAQRFGSTIGALREFNGLSESSRLHPGQMLIIPSLARTGPPQRGGVGRLARATVTATPPATTDAARPKTAPAKRAKARHRHIVAAGETLWSISQRYNVTVAELRRWNGRRSNDIGVGDVLEVF